MKTILASQIETWNERIKAGEGHIVARELNRLSPDRIPTDLLAKIANLCWRINRPNLGLKLLYPSLRRQNGLKMRQNLFAFTEYAGCLLEAGALSEARQMLKELGGLTPRSKFYSSLLMIKEWNYKAAIPMLLDYLKDIPDDYHRLVVRVNLASSYVNTGQWPLAFSLLRELQTELAARSHWLLLGNCHEIESQIYFEQGDHEKALSCLAESERFLGNTKNMGWLYCKKWQFINRMHLSPGDQLPEQGSPSAPIGKNGTGSDLAKELSRLKGLAREMSSFETLRELDLHWAIRASDARLLNHVYYGSPYEIYRRKIRDRARKANPRLEITSTYAWIPKPSPDSSPRLLDLESVVFGEMSDSRGFLLKKLLLALLSDLYAPFRVGQLFSRLFPGEYYNLDSSPDRIFQLIRRLRHWLASIDGGLEIESGAKGYVLKFAANRGVILTSALSEHDVEHKSNLHFLSLRQHLADRPFTSAELGSLMNCSARTANRILKTLKSDGRVTSLGRGRHTRFRIVS